MLSPNYYREFGPTCERERFLIIHKGDQTMPLSYKALEMCGVLVK